MKDSPLFKLNWKDAVNGFITAFLTAFLTQVYQSIEAGSLPTVAQLKASALVGLAGGLGYVIKKIFQGEAVPKDKK